MWQRRQASGEIFVDHSNAYHTRGSNRIDRLCFYKDPYLKCLDLLSQLVKSIRDFRCLIYGPKVLFVCEHSIFFTDVGNLTIVGLTVKKQDNILIKLHIIISMF